MMAPTIRSALVLLGGVIAAVFVVILMDTLVGNIYSLPAGAGASPESLRQAVASLPIAAFVILVTGWVLAAGVGSYLAARLATHARAVHGRIVAMFVLVATLANLAKIPHPLWLWPATIILIPAAGWVATRLATRHAVVS
jgi:hypothetical protein